MLPIGSTNATLYQTDPNGFIVDGPVLTSLRAHQVGQLEAHELTSIVRITGIFDLADLPLGPEDVVDVEKVEVLAGHVLDLTGRVWLMGEGQSCVLMALDDGRVVELLGPKVDTIRSVSWANGAWIHLTGTDLGRSTTSCSGGRRLQVRTFSLAKRE